MLALAGTQATAGLPATPGWLELLGQLGPQAPQVLLELFERVRSHRQARLWVPARTPKWLPRLKTYASRRSLSPQEIGIASGNFNPFHHRDKWRVRPLAILLSKIARRSPSHHTASPSIVVDAVRRAATASLMRG
jgi:hypothetical protein